MTRKDYLLIAGSFADAHQMALGADQKEGVETAAILVSRKLAADNSAFDRTRFLRACGLNIEGA